MSRKRTTYVEIEQLCEGFWSLGHLKAAVDSAYEQYGDVEFADGNYPDDHGYPCYKVIREMTQEEIAKEKQDQEAYQRKEFERIGNEYGWEYE